MAEASRPIVSKFRTLLPFIKEERWRLAFILVFSAFGAGLAALTPWPVKFAVDVALGETPAPDWMPNALASNPSILIVACAAGTVAILMLSAILNNALTWLWAAAGHNMLYSLATTIFGHLQRMSLLFHQKQTGGDLLSRVTGDSWCVYTTAAALLVSPLRQILTILAIGYASLTLDPLLTLTIFILAPVIAISVYYFGGTIKQRSKSQRESEAELATFSQQTLSNIPVVQVFGLKERNTQIFAGIAKRLIHTARSVALTQQLYGLVNASALGAGIAMVLFFGTLKVNTGDLTVGELLIFMAYVETLKAAFQQLLDSYSQVRTVEASVDRVNAILDMAPDILDPADARPLRLTGKGGARIDFENVSFRYDADHPTLHGVSLRIERGETIAIVGASGAGKTTITGLIPRFFDPDTGAVSIEGQNLRDVTLKSLRRQVALVLQDPFILPITIAENIAFGCNSSSLDEIRAAAEAAKAERFIEELPDGYDTVIGERGATLSGGQKQRVAIARALLRDAPILILDEPTSALDPKTEASILVALERLISDRTTIIIAHRLSTIAKADRIAVLEAGHIVELGTRDELLAQGGQYWRYETLQAAGAKFQVPA